MTEKEFRELLFSSHSNSQATPSTKKTSSPSSTSPNSSQFEISSLSSDTFLSLIQAYVLGYKAAREMSQFLGLMLPDVEPDLYNIIKTYHPIQFQKLKELVGK